jgi:hypothetical protein
VKHRGQDGCQSFGERPDTVGGRPGGELARGTTKADNIASSLLRIDVERSRITVLDNTGCPPAVPAGDVVVARIDPVSATVGSTVPVTITGSGFAPAMSVSFENGSGPPPAAKNVIISSDGIQAMVTIKNGKPGKNPVWDVRVGEGVLFNGFTAKP